MDNVIKYFLVLKFFDNEASLYKHAPTAIGRILSDTHKIEEKKLFHDKSPSPLSLFLQPMTDLDSLFTILKVFVVLTAGFDAINLHI